MHRHTVPAQKYSTAFSMSCIHWHGSGSLSAKSTTRYQTKLGSYSYSATPILQPSPVKMQHNSYHRAFSFY